MAPVIAALAFFALLLIPLFAMAAFGFEAPFAPFDRRIVSFAPVFWTPSATVCAPQMVLADFEFRPVKWPGSALNSFPFALVRMKALFLPITCQRRSADIAAGKPGRVHTTCCTLVPTVKELQRSLTG